MMINKLTKILLLILVSAIFAGCSTAHDISYKIVEKSGYFTVGYDASSYHTYDGYGLAVNIIKLAAQRMGVDAPIRPVNDYDWDVYIKNGDIDVMLCKTSADSLQTSTIFTDDILMISASEDIKNVGVMDTDACVAQKNTLSYQYDYEFIYYSDSNLLLADLSSDILDAIIVSEYDALSQQGISEYTLQVLSESPIVFSVSSEKQTFYEKLNAVLAQMTSDGTTARLKREFIDSLD